MSVSHRLDISDACSEMDVTEWSLLGDLILLEIIEKPGHTASGIILPKGEQSECSIGKIMRVGSGHTNVVDGTAYPLELSVGDTALTMDYMGDRAEVKGKKYRLVREHGIWAKVEMGKGNAFKSVQPRADCILVEIDKDSAKSSGGVFLPQGDATENCIGHALSVGEGSRNLKSGVVIPNSVEAGSKVVFRRYAGAEVRVEGHERKLRIMQDRDVVCVIEGDAK